ncbi:hypothetical protein D9M68_863310 [compost metagenome]
MRRVVAALDLPFLQQRLLEGFEHLGLKLGRLEIQVGANASDLARPADCQVHVPHALELPSGVVEAYLQCVQHPDRQKGVNGVFD